MKSEDIALMNDNPYLWEFVNKVFWNYHFLSMIEFTDISTKAKYITNNENIDYVRNSADEAHNLYLEFIKFSDDDLIKFKALYRIKLNMLMRKYRYKRILKDWLNKGLQVVFLSLTFDDNQLEKGFDSCRKFITSWLADHCDDYMANDDYGDDTNRLHFHAIAILKNNSYDLQKTYIDKFQVQHYKLLNYPYISDVSMVIRSDTDRVTKYFNKIANHAFKASATSSHSIIRPRKKKFTNNNL